MVFTYFQFIVWEGLIIGRPVNPYQILIEYRGDLYVNPSYADFAEFQNEMMFGTADDQIKPGLYHRGDIELKLIDGKRFYILKELTESNASAER